MGRSLRLVCLVAAVSFVAGACTDRGSPAGPPAPSGSARGFPVTIGAQNGPVTLDRRPERIVSLSPTATEMLFAIGAGDQVVAVDDQSNYPADAPTTNLSGYEPNAEAIAAYDPDLVVYSNDLGDIARAFDDLGISALLEPAAAELDDVYHQIDELGTATGHGQEASDVVGSMRSDIADIAASVPSRSNALTYYHELDDTYYSVTSSTFIGQVYDVLGLANIADAADSDGTGYPQLSAEYIVKADPDLIFLADTKCCGQSPATLAGRDGWSGISAVRNGAVVPLDDDVASRWGPRVVDFLRIVARAIRALESQAA